MNARLRRAPYHGEVKVSLQRSFLLAMMVLIVGCRRPAAPTSASGLAHFAVRGQVVSTDAATGEVTLDHEAIPGFMDAMTMPYKLAQPGVIGELHPGDRITAQLDVVKDADGFHDAKLDQIVIVAQARPDYRPAVEFHVSRNFAAIDQALAADPTLYAKTHLLSISFDPAYDKPAVLRSYGGAYTGNYTNEQFAHWDFAAPPKAELPVVTQYFDVGVTPGENGSLTHSLSTILIGRDGKVAAWYPTNDWEPQEILQAVKDAAGK